jgi:SAM-dependent methyltransferase
VTFPYLDKTLALLEAGDPEATQVFGRHWHWGYWPDPALATGTVADFIRAEDRMSEYFLDVAGIRDGDRVLDAGCGFGGTIAIANERRRGVALTGLNIDPRQLALARENVRARDGNTAVFVEGDACRPPFADRSFDRVIAVECIFHFPSRRRFFEEAHRLLEPGGQLTVSDFVPPWVLPNTPLRLLFSAGRSRRERAWGVTHSLEGTEGFYRDVAKQTGFDIVRAVDITANVQPTHGVLAQLTGRLGGDVVAEVKDIDAAMKLRLCRYRIMVFQRR